MFSLFGRKPRKGPEQLIPELRRHAVQIEVSTGISHLVIASAMLSFGVSLFAQDKGLAGLTAAMEILSTLIKQEKDAHGSLGSSIMKIGLPELPSDQCQLAVDQLGKSVVACIKQGYSMEAVGVAMVSVAGDVARLLDKHNVLPLALLQKEYESRRLQYRRERLRHTVAGECTEAPIDILLQAEAEGFALTIEKDRTFVLSKHGLGSTYLRSNAEIERFGRQMAIRKDAVQANRTPVERLIGQGDDHLKSQNLEGAIGSYSAALRINPDSAELYFKRGVAWSNKYYNEEKKPSDLQKAIDDYTRAIELHPECGEAYFQRAELWFKAG